MAGEGRRVPPGREECHHRGGVGSPEHGDNARGAPPPPPPPLAKRGTRTSLLFPLPLSLGSFLVRVPRYGDCSVASRGVAGNDRTFSFGKTAANSDD